MLDDFSVAKRVLHRRGHHQKNQVFPIFPPLGTDTTTTDPAATTTTTQDNNNPFTGLFPPAPSTTSSTSILPILPTDLPTTTSSSITTSSSTTETSSSTTSTSSSTTTSLSLLLPTTTSSTSTTSLLPTTIQDATTEVQVTITQSHSTTSAGAVSFAASPTSTTTEKTGVSGGVLIGGIIAVVVAVAGIVFAVVYFIRRSRKANEEDDFNADVFRRQSMMIPGNDDVSVVSRTPSWNRGGARPPTMIEQKLAYNPVSYAPPVPQPYAYGPGYNQPSFSPGQVYTPTTAMNSANPFISPYERTPMHTPAPQEAFYDAQGNIVSRHMSASSSTVVPSRHGSAVPDKPLSDVGAEGDYVDLSRSSVTPFQAQQYADISRRLNAPPPQGLSLTAVNEDEYEHAQEGAVPAPVPEVPQKNDDPRENALSESPFADPGMTEQQQDVSKHDSVDSVLSPPEPAFAPSSPKDRVASIPPRLPSMAIQERAFEPVMETLDFPAVPSNGIPTPPPNVHFADVPAPAPTTAPAPAPTTAPAPTARPGSDVPAAKRPDTVYTLYDDEDAYGGI